MTRRHDNPIIRQSRTGIVLLLTLVLLVVLATLGYTFSSRVAAQRHRNQYIIDYSRARYGCDSAVKYALATLEELDPQLVDRPNEPDFSDLFALDEVAYQELLVQWGMGPQRAELNGKGSFDDMNDSNDANATADGKNMKSGSQDLDSVVVRGPYGPPWPFVTELAEFEIGPTTIRMEIEDENAKYPLGLALLDDKDLAREAEAGYVTFCEMMQLDATQIDSLRDQLQKVGEIRPFMVDFKPITKAVSTPTPAKPPPTPTPAGKAAPKTPQPTAQRKVIPVAEQIAKQTTDLAKLFHSSLIDTEALAAPIFVSENRKESALKYMGLWGSQQVNVNTAPRHVLEAAFIFGGNEVEIADSIIQLRREKPVANLQELKTALPRYADSIGKCEKYIATASRCFTIRITAVCGVAKTSSLIAITKEGNQVKKIAVING
jgi:Tfp pilus assembly protein PilX